MAVIHYSSYKKEANIRSKMFFNVNKFNMYRIKLVLKSKNGVSV